MPYTHLERLSACSVFCSRGHTATDTGVRHQVPSHNWSPSGIRLIFGRSSARRPYLQMPQWHPRVAKGSSIRPSARRPCPQVLQSHPGVAKGSSISSSARRPYLQMPQWHPRVAKRASIGTLARGPSTEALLGQGRVPKERKSVPLTGLWSGSRPGLARHPRLQVLQSHPGVAKRSSISSSARRPCPQVPQWHPRVAKEAFEKAKGAVLGNIKCDGEAACLQLGCRLSSLFL